MDKAVAIVGSPRLTAYDMLLWRSEENAIREDKDWNGGSYITEPNFRNGRRDPQPGVDHPLLSRPRNFAEQV
jgi:homoserine acetyltransferase